jgi:eukaryotic-like serine/threonine-protein kinase
MAADSTPLSLDPTPSSDTSLPRAFGHYLLFDRIGRGGMAEIFLARMTTDLGVARRVVVKEILPELSSDTGFARMLVQEAKLSAKLSHRNIVRVLDLGREAGRLFIAMEYVEGYDLNQLLRELSRRRLPLPAEFALFVVREVLAALDYAHRATDGSGTPLAIVHRDISPSNVLISFEGEVSLCDFGIARALSYEPDAGATDATGSHADQDESRVQRARVAGKSAYMAPEHARGDDIDARSDLFAAGILLWELCAGRRLYKGTEHEMLDMARRAEVPPLPERGLYDLPRLQAILERALAKDPAVRYQSAGQMLKDLDEYALSAQLMASQLRFATFLTEHFAEDIVALRLTREHAAAEALLRPPAQVSHPEPVISPSDPPRAALPVVSGPVAISPPRSTPPRAPVPQASPHRLWLGLGSAMVLAALAWLLSR